VRSTGSCTTPSVRPTGPTTPRTLGAATELLAVDDAVPAVALFQPAQADEGGDRLVHPFAGRAHHPRQLLLRDRELEVVALTRELEQPLRGAAGDVEEHAVGECLVGRAQPRRE
jgi:hypothetical protein